MMLMKMGGGGGDALLGSSYVHVVEARSMRDVTCRVSRPDRIKGVTAVFVYDETGSPPNR